MILRHARGAVRGLAGMPSTGPIKKLMAANRGEIAIRIFRAATELNIRTVAIFSKEDIGSVHRYKADEAYQVGAGKGPLGAYLAYEEIVEMALKHRVDAIHPGYGFLSENPNFARLCEENGIRFVGPTAKSLVQFGDKTKARQLAIEHGVPVVPGTDHPLEDPAAAKAWCAQHGYPVILKAAHGGGGKGMRVVRSEAEIETSFALCSGEALKSFGNGEIFIERYVDRPRHIEIQILGDGSDVVHLYDRDCSVQRRHQKVVEVAPASGLPPALRQRLFDDAVRITKACGYRAAGTVEYLVEPATGNYYFIEVNPRVQVEHTVTEVITGIDIVQSQILIAGGAKLEKDLGLTQAGISTRGYAIQCRVTTEDPANNFQPDTGRLQVWRPAEGFGIRLDGGNSYAGSVISPYYDSMLMKVTGSALTFEGTAAKVSRALRESRIRGVKTNIPFMLNVLKHPIFLSASCTTSFIEDSSAELFDFPRDASQDRATKMLDYLAELAVNGRQVVGAEGPATRHFEVVLPSPALTEHKTPPPGLKQVLEAGGPEAFAKAVRAHKGLLLTDTTWRDAHQSLLATRMRTRDLTAIAPATAQLLHPLYSIENWGGATFDVALRFLHECPWERLAEMREAVPNIPFQMLLRGANAVGYTSYPDNAVHKFCDVAVKNGMDVFRVFDSLNYLDNMKLGIDAVGSAGGVVEAAVAYTGDITDASKGKYTLDYYLEFVRQLVAHKIHVLAIKDMAGLLKPAAATALVSAIRAEFPHLPIHVHTHDTAGTGVASMLAAAHAGADVVDCAIDPMSGTTSQPAMGAIIGTTLHTPLATGLAIGDIVPLMDYWESVRMSYSAFEANQKSGSADVYLHEMPGGQYTNLLFQSKQLGLSGQWPEVKKAYAQANLLLGDIVKVTPSSKVVGDLAQFMVANKLSPEELTRDAGRLNFPSSVVEYFEGLLGVPPGGFPPELQAAVLKGRPPITGRPGASMPPIDFEALRAELAAKLGSAPASVPDTDLMSYTMYPKVFLEYKAQIAKYGSLAKLPTRAFVEPMEKGDSLEVEIEEGKLLSIKLLAIGELVPKSGTREVFFELNGVPRSVVVSDRTAAASTTMRPKASKEDAGQVGAPMGGMVVSVKVKEGDSVAEGANLMTLSAMKMETAIAAPVGGTVAQVTVALNEDVAQGDMLVRIVPHAA